MPPAAVIPEALRSSTERAIEACPGLDQLPEAVRAALPRVWACSEFVARACRQDAALFATPAWLAALMQAGSPATRVRAALAGVGDETALLHVLRTQRRREMLRIAWRDLAGWADLEETLHDLSDLADACTDGALAALSRWHAERHGSARNAHGVPQSLVVLGMGKLGARELNFSSDIDLIFCYPENGRSDGERPLDNEEYFTRLGQRLIRTLDQVNEDGFVFRVDMRLRPFGEAGPLAMSFSALETYYQNHGRDWERYALVKARPVAGDVRQGEALLETLRPFVYRRYLDFNAFEALREMKHLIDQDVVRRGLEDNIKLGRGGIREIEFIGQVFQLIRGGREAPLRARGLLAVLHHLGAHGYLKEHEAQELAGAYVFLRRVENRLQMVRDQQTHDLPHDELERARLALSMGFETWPAFATALERERRRVQQLFDAVFAAPRAVRQTAPQESPFAAVWRDVSSSPEAAAVLENRGFRTPTETLGLLVQLREGPLLRALNERARHRMDELVPRLLDVAATSEAPDQTLQRLLRVVEAIARRSAYLALLVERPTVLEHLARLAAHSAWLADMVARTPLLLDELIDPRVFSEFPSRESLHAELENTLRGVDADDLEAQMDALRQFQQTAVVRVAAADIAGDVPLMKVSDFLTWIAEQVIGEAFRIAWRHLTARHGEPHCRDARGERPARFAVVAYGKLGGIELGYGSDLDLVFLHDSTGEAQATRGERALDNHEFFTRLAQRIINILSVPTTSGMLYQVDTRLRPSGSAGLMVSSLDAFTRYQHEHAWTWEHQALLRARPVAGDADLGAAFDALRREILGRPRDAEKLRHDVADMRARMLAEHAHADDGFDLKLDAGGLTDIEFLVQYLVLHHAAAHPALLDWTDNIRNLDGLMEAGILDAERGGFLADTYRAFRRIVHRAALEGRTPRIAPAAGEPGRSRVRALWQEYIGTPAAAGKGLV
ncbi:MAG TPA: bifunctional [glutamate--ammonia ligase]-adenylyl-L-tyrosine phosphorylase/[glutamate--ammonia-ligase] adenylyltransferase [Gammaproteobacteria bacterium]|nr:bifunctional [glutamate--ammonia ligase]-adenylyl-L-tyrosine phosphorylase/[glutamate--ammonia-ligase] adenylyltransferase [Gammaproteobacteria bacterium]